jgi:hypothetical protein
MLTQEEQYENKTVNVEDIQTVAEQELERELTDEEIKIVEDRLGDYIDWYGSIASVLGELKELKKQLREKRIGKVW